MGQCACHPETETSFLCMKHNKYLCEECLKCQDPGLYCKFRPSCPVWFMEKRQKRWEAEEKRASAGEYLTVRFMPDDTQGQVTAGSTLLEAAAAAGVHINASCSGKGSCGKCKLIVESGKVASVSTPLLSEGEKRKNYVLACQSTVREDLVVRIPDEALSRKLKAAGMGEEATTKLLGLIDAIEPMMEEISLTLPQPTLDDSVSDLDRLQRALKKVGCDVERMNVGIKVLRDLAAAVRKENGQVTVDLLRRKCANEILQVRSGNGQKQPLGLAIDLGTTSIVVYLVDMADGAVLAATSGHNRQAACGDDVINRIVCAEKDGVKKLSRMALATINNLIGEALDSAGRKATEIKNVVVAGNTTMTHLLLQIEPRYIRREPYIPTVSDFPVLKAAETGIKADPAAAVFVMPGPAGYVGGDIVSGLLFAGFHRQAPLTLFIDIGTNGEIVLGNEDWLMTAACSAGPAFEGGGVRWGMRAEEGAIEKIAIDPETLLPMVETVGGATPRGICGSGMIDLLSEMLAAGIIDRSGRFELEARHERMTRVHGEPAYVLVFSRDTAMGEDIVFTETDIKTLMLSKGAVYAGFTVLLNQAGLDFSMVEQVVITGGFGQYLNIEKAVAIGLLPDIDREKFRYLGNSAIAGAYMALLSDRYRKEARQICSSMTYIDFSSLPSYMDEFTSALFLPHTDLAAFPSVHAARSQKPSLGNQ